MHYPQMGIGHWSELPHQKQSLMRGQTSFVQVETITQSTRLLIILILPKKIDSSPE
jgi:hypothetical protein